MKRSIKINESDLHKIVNNSVMRILREQYENFNSDEVYDYLDDLVNRLGVGYMFEAIIGKIDRCTLYHWLKSIDELNKSEEDGAEY